MNAAKINLDRSRGAFGTLCRPHVTLKLKVVFLSILESREVNIAFQRLHWNDLNESLRKLKAKTVFIKFYQDKKLMSLANQIKEILIVK